jgi:DNA-binding XRE family transcriptional regulator
MSIRKKTAQRRSTLKESAARIFALREALEKNQTDFAKLFKGTSRESVSAWEKPRALPSAEKYFKMFQLALKLQNLNIDATWFLEQAGIDAQEFYELSETYARDQESNQKSIVPDAVFYAPLLRGVESALQPKITHPTAMEMRVPLPSFFAHNGPGSIVCLRVPNALSSLGRPPHFDVNVKKVQAEGFSTSPEREHLSAPVFRKGDIAVIDWSVRNLPDLEDQIIALSFSYQVKFASSSDSSEAWSTPVLHVGWLRRGQIPLAPSDSSFGRERAAQLKAENRLLKQIGMPSRPADVASPYYYLFPSPDAAGQHLASAITNFAAQPQLSKGYRVIGRVVGWIADESHPISKKVKP